MQAGEFSKATEYFERAVRIAPKSAKLHTALSSSRMSQGDNARAIAELEMAAARSEIISGWHSPCDDPSPSQKQEKASRP